MARGKSNGTPLSIPPMKPATTPEAREMQMVSLAVDLAEQQLRDGTASSQVICHYLKLGSTREKLEKEILESQKRLTEAKTESYYSAQQANEMYDKVMNALKTYSGQDEEYVED